MYTPVQIRPIVLVYTYIYMYTPVQISPIVLVHKYIYMYTPVQISPIVLVHKYIYTYVHTCTNKSYSASTYVQYIGIFSQQNMYVSAFHITL